MLVSYTFKVDLRPHHKNFKAEEAEAAIFWTHNCEEENTFYMLVNWELHIIALIHFTVNM